MDRRTDRQTKTATAIAKETATEIETATATEIERSETTRACTCRDGAFLVCLARAFARRSDLREQAGEGRQRKRWWTRFSLSWMRSSGASSSSAGDACVCVCVCLPRSGWPVQNITPSPPFLRVEHVAPSTARACVRADLSRTCRAVEVEDFEAAASLAAGTSNRGASVCVWGGSLVG